MHACTANSLALKILPLIDSSPRINLRNRANSVIPLDHRRGGRVVKSNEPPQFTLLPAFRGRGRPRHASNKYNIGEGTMSKVRVAAFSISIDGFGAGPRQDLQNPLGVRGTELHGWFFPTEIFKKKIQGQSGGTTGIDNEMAAQSFENVGAWILGRNMFGPVRGAWASSGEPWNGWWGPNPPYHTPVFVLTHHARPPLEMEGGTTFHFVTDGLESALRQAKAAAKGKDVRIGGGVSVLKQYLLADQIDEMHLAMSPVLMGEGENLFSGINLHQLGFKIVRVVAGENTTHVFVKKG
jgi:dihydrofolate reductase